MRNRNTVGDQWRPNPQKNQANSVDRKTMTNPQNTAQIQSRQVAQQQQNQKMCQKINKVLNKFPEQGKRSSISSIIQPKASTMNSNISVLMNSIDHNFERSNVDIETIQQLLSFWGYPHNYNKSVFQPIGAPHTWPACLQMMQFLAQIANYFFQYRNTTDDYKLDTEEIDLILDCFSTQDCSLYDAYLQKQRFSLSKQQSDLVFKIQSAELMLKNIKNSQRSLSQVQAEEQVIQQRLQRESQNVIEIDQQNNTIISQIQKTDDQIQQLQITKSSLMKKISMLQQQISNQQLSAQQASKIQFQIKEYHSRIKDVNNQMESRKKQYQSEKNKIVQNYYKIIDQLNEVKNSIKRYQNQLQVRGIQMPLPESNHVAFTQAIHTQDMNVFQQNLVKMIDSQKIKTMLLTQESLADVLQHQTKVLCNQIAQLQSKKNIIENQNRECNSQVQKLTKFTSQLQKQLANLSNKHAKIMQQKQQIKQKTNIVKSKSQQLLRRQIQLTQQIRQRKEHMVEGVRLLKKYESDCEQAIKKMEEKQEQTKKKVSEILLRIQGGFSFLNKQLEDLQ